MEIKHLAKSSSSIRLYLSWVFAGTLLCGLLIAGYFTLSFTSIERLQYEVSGNSLAMREIQSLSEQLDLLLVAADLAVGSHETYTGRFAVNLSTELRKQVDELQTTQELPLDQSRWEQVPVLLLELEKLIKTQETTPTASHSIEEQILLAEFDTVAGELVAIFEDSLAFAGSFTDRRSRELISRRADMPGALAIALVLYFLANGLIVMWTLRKIVWPLERLTRYVDDVREHRGKSELDFRGPQEIARLATHFQSLIEKLEEKVRERTRKIHEKTKILQHEIEERSAIQKALEKAKEQAERSNLAKSAFLSSMSHELRTPMNAVLGSLSLIRDSGINREQEKYVNIADESGQALVELLGEILDLSKIESEELTLKQDPFSIPAVVSSTTNMLGERAREKGLRISTRVEPELPSMLIGDFNRVRQILTNLVNNAIKFTNSGYVAIHVCSEDSSPQNSRVKFSVTDSGIGISKSEFKSIFESFTQADGSLTREHYGVGLGLAICSKLADAMGGECGVESVEGKGSTFWFAAEFPISSACDITKASNHATDVAGRRVLVVKNEDQFSVDWIEGVLQSYDVTCLTVPDFAEAQKRIQSDAGQHQRADWVVIPVAERSAALAQKVKDLDASLASGGGKIILLNTGGEALFGSMVEQGLIACEHMGCLSQDTLIDVVLERSSEPDRIEATILPERSECKSEALQSERQILVVEDCKTNRMIVGAVLKNAGFKVEMVASGREAISAAHNQLFDVILMDLQMSGMDGFETTSTIRSRASLCKNTPIIALSANAMEETKRECLEVGMNDFVSKPFVKKNLLDKISHWILRSEKQGFSRRVMPLS